MDTAQEAKLKVGDGQQVTVTVPHVQVNLLVFNNISVALLAYSVSLCWLALIEFYKSFN